MNESNKSSAQTPLKKKKLYDMVSIGLLVALILIIAGVAIYRAVDGNRVSQEEQLMTQFDQTLERLSHPENVLSIDVTVVNQALVSHTAFDTAILSDPRAAGDLITDPEVQNDIIKGDFITIRYRDGSCDNFYLRNGCLYWGASIPMEWPAFLNWLETQ